MAVIETWYNQDLQEPVKVHYLDGSMFSHNGNGNCIGVHVFNNGEPVTLSGTVSGYVVTADGSTVPCTGTRSGNSASILIPAAAYQPGAVFITVFLTDGSTVTTLASVATNVLTARTNNQVSPGSVVTDWTQTINAAMQSVENAAENLGGIVATPYASLTFPVPLGKYTYYNGNLYRCISPIATSEEFTAAHWTQVRLGDDVSDLKSAFTSNVKSVGSKIGANMEYATISNGTYANSGNANHVHTNEIPVDYGDSIRLYTNRPLAEGHEYSYNIVLLKSDKSTYTTTDYVLGFQPYIVINSPVKYVVFNFVEKDANSTTVALRKTDFAGYSVWLEVSKQDNIVDSEKAEANYVPMLRNGSMGNSMNTSKIATFKKFPVNSARAMQLEYLNEIPEGHTLTWNVELMNASGGTVRNYDFTGAIVSLTTYLKQFTTITDVAFDLQMTDSSSNAVALRIESSGNCVRVQYFDDKYLESVYDLLKPALNREVIAFVASAGKIIFKDRPIFRNSGRCAWKLNNQIGFKTGSTAIAYISASTIIAACSTNDSLTEDGETWIYLRTNSGIVYDASTMEVSIIDLSDTTKLTGNRYLLIGVWSGQFIGGLLYEKFLQDAYATPATAFNSSNLTYDIDVSAKAKEFDNHTGSSADTEAFLFFTDPHTYSKYWNTDPYTVAKAEYFQTVIQKYYNSTPTSFVLCGGDWLTAEDTKEMAKYKLGLCEASMESMVSPYYPMNGNHDTNYQGASGAELSTGEIVNVMFHRQGKAYYSFMGTNTKFYIFDSMKDGTQNMSSYLWEQIAWCASALKSEESSHIAFGIHIWLDGATERAFVGNLRDLISAYNNRSVIELNGTDYDYTESTGKIEFVIAGHTHADGYATVNSSVPVIITTNAFQDGVACFDLIYADYTEKKVFCTRVGNGSSRAFSLETGEPIT